MATNRFAAQCAICGRPVPAGDGTVHTDHGGRTVTHLDCTPPGRVGRSFTVRRIDHDVETILAATEVDAGYDARTARRLSLAAVAALVLVGAVAVAAMRGDASGRGATAPGPPVATTVLTQVAGAVEVARTSTSPPTTLAPATTAVPSTTAAPTTSVDAAAPAAEPTPAADPAPPPPSPTTEPTTEPTTTLAPSTTVAPTSTARPATTTTPSTTAAPAPTTTRRGSSGRSNATG